MLRPLIRCDAYKRPVTHAFLSQPSVLAGLYAIGLLLIVGAALLWHRRVLRTDALARRWLTVAGKIESADVVEHWGDSRQYEPRILYGYSVDGRWMEGRHLRVGGPARRYLNRRGQAEAMIAPYRPGAAVTVHYDPQRPDRSVLEMRPSLAGVQPLFLGGCVAIGVAIALSLGLRLP
jgi:hypothetical protein